MILIMKILLHNIYKIISLRYPTYVYQFFNFPYNYNNRVQGPDTQKHLSPTYLSAVHVTAVKTTYFIESVYSKLRLS